MKEILEYLAKALVNNPEAVEVDEFENDGLKVLELKVDPEDLGRVIGKQGRTANALRTIIRAVATRQGEKATVEIVDSE